jgi:hypothetical protein
MTACPNWAALGRKDQPCPYGGTGCGKACADSWDGDGCYVRDGDAWVWTEQGQPACPHGHGPLENGDCPNCGFST